MPLLNNSLAISNFGKVAKRKKHVYPTLLLKTLKAIQSRRSISGVRKWSIDHEEIAHIKQDMVTKYCYFLTP